MSLKRLYNAGVKKSASERKEHIYNMEWQISAIRGIIKDFFGENFIDKITKKGRVNGRQLCAYLLYLFTDLSTREIGEVTKYKSTQCTHHAIREVRRKCREYPEAKKMIIGIETISELTLNKDMDIKRADEVDFHYCAHFGCTNVLTLQQRLMSKKCPMHIEAPNLYSLIDKKLSNDRPKKKRQNRNGVHTHRSRHIIHIPIDTAV